MGGTGLQIIVAYSKTNRPKISIIAGSLVAIFICFLFHRCLQQIYFPRYSRKKTYAVRLIIFFTLLLRIFDIQQHSSYRSCIAAMVLHEPFEVVTSKSGEESRSEKKYNYSTRLFHKLKTVLLKFVSALPVCSISYVYQPFSAQFLMFGLLLVVFIGRKLIFSSNNQE